MATLTNDQQAGSDAFFHFLMTDERYFVLSGGAGVGKTFLMGHISNDVLSLYEQSCKLLNQPVQYETAVFTATTNKAAEVLEKAIQRPVRTIHSFLGLKVHENTKTGKTTLQKSGAWKEHRNIILFIDESSMIDTDLLKEIDEAVIDSKIVFVGDHAQMAPVNEKLSPIYEKVHKDNFVFLSESVRNAGSPALMDLCAQLRDTVETGVFKPIKEVPGTVDYLSPEQMQAKLMAYFYDPKPSARILCYTNDRVQTYNTYLREMKNLPPTFTVGDHLVVASAYNYGKTALNVEREVTVRAVGTSVVSIGYEWATPSKNPILCRTLSITDDNGILGPMDVSVAENPEEYSATLKHLAKIKSWAAYFELKNSVIDLRDRDACTVYKSQGSTYDAVFIDLGNIGSSYDAEQVARMLFVAVSRARHNVYLYGELPRAYRGKAAA